MSCRPMRPRRGGSAVSDIIVIDEYELVNCVATGNATQIWEVKKKGSGKQLAMKLLLDESFQDPEQKKSLKHEANVGKAFDHPNLIRVFDLVVNKKHGYFTMEYFRSLNLKSMLRNELPAAQARLKKLMEALTQALAHMHEKGWLHRDIKPDNILLTKGGEVKLIDFSLAAKPAGMLTKLRGGSKKQLIQGTRTYIPPEAIRRRPITEAADIYSLGVTLYEVLAGRPPFIHGNPNELLMAHVRELPDKPSGYNENVSPEADDLTMRLLSKEPKDRPASMQELFAEVRAMKFFKEEPEEYARQKAAQEEARFEDSVAARLDSRTDDARDRSLDAQRPKPAPAPKPAVEREKKPAQQPVAQTQNPPQVPPGYPTPPAGYPQQGGVPAYPYQYPPQAIPPQGQQPAVPQLPPGYYPQQPPPGYAYPPGYVPPPGTVPPGQVPPVPVAPPPGAAPGPPAGEEVPQGGSAPASSAAEPATAPPTAAEPSGQQSVPSQPAAPAPSPPSDQEKDDDIPLMTELPDVI